MSATDASVSSHWGPPGSRLSRGSCRRGQDLKLLIHGRGGVEAVGQGPLVAGADQSLMCKCLSVHMNIYQQGGGFLQYSRALALPSAISDQHPETAFVSSHCPASRTAAGASCAVVSQLSLPILCRNCNRRIVSLPVLKLASIRFVH